MDLETWTRHFRRMAEGKLQPNAKGYYVVDQTRDTNGPEDTDDDKLKINMISPVEQAVDLAKSEMQQQQQQQKGKGYKKKREADQLD